MIIGGSYEGAGYFGGQIFSFNGTAIFNDSISMSETFSKSDTMSAFLDMITLSDTLSYARQLIDNFNEIIFLTETFIWNFSRTFLDDITLTGTINALRGLVILLGDVIIITDGLANSFSFAISRIFTDVITMSEVVLKYLNGLLQNWNKIPKPLIGFWNKIVKSNP